VPLVKAAPRFVTPFAQVGTSTRNFSWEREHAKSAGSLSLDELPYWFLNEDLCIVDSENFFLRGVIHLPIIGTAEAFCWGVWGSLSKENFKKFVSALDEPEHAELPRMFS
jgi:hypothetical protein